MMEVPRGFFSTVDELAMGRARRGDNEALERIYRTFERPVFALAMRLSGSREEAEEIAQETFLEVLRSLGSFRGDGAFGAWLRRVAASKALMRLRRPSREVTREGIEDDADFPYEGQVVSAVGVTDRVDLERALAALGPVSRAIVWLHDVEGMTHGEIAALSGRSESFSKSQLARAHTSLRRWLSGHGSRSDAPEHGRAAGAARR